MASKLMTLKELSEYLSIREQDIVELIDSNVIIAYKIGGELLRFRKEQIDATRAEIDAKIIEIKKEPSTMVDSRVKERIRAIDGEVITNSFGDKIKDFLYFNDFYILSAVLIVLLVLYIVKG